MRQVRQVIQIIQSSSRNRTSWVHLIIEHFNNKRMLHHLDQRFIQLSMRILKSFLHFNRMILIQVLKKCTQFYSNLLKLWWYKVHLTFEFPQLKRGFNRKSSFSVLKSNLTLSKALLLYFQRALFWSHYSILISTIPT